ncbi:MAG: response regulator [Ignavibacteria bacterium]|nr:response regulator [Ignavibacteria bacterium]
MEKEKITILVVEDEALIAMDIAEKLSDMGYYIPQTTDNGIDAIRLAGELTPDIVLMDIVIKGEMDGIETAEEIRNRFNIPSLFLTAYNSSTIIDRAMKINPAGFLLKPFEDTKLQQAILDLNIHGAINGCKK